MQIYLDECSDADLLVVLLQKAGHHVETPRSAGLSGRHDAEHLQYAAEQARTLVTENPRDYRRLHSIWQAQGRRHSGILLIYQDNMKGKDMEPSDIVRALGNLITSGIPIANDIHVLNHWR